MNLVATRWWSMFFMPSSVLLTGLALGLLLVLLAWRRGRKPSEARLSIALLVGSALLLYLASTPLVAAWAANTLESGYPPVDPTTLPKADAIVVLGGSLHATTAPDGTVHLYANHASDRFETAMQAFAAGRYPDTIARASEVVAQGGARALDARVLIGKARNAMGQRAEAVRALRMVLDRDPTHRGARSALTAMGETL